MARAFILSTQTVAASAVTITVTTRFGCRDVPCICRRRRWLWCKGGGVQEKTTMEVMEKYKEAFSKRMALAGLQPHHRIGIGVSGGPDSMALCLLAAGWKTEGGGNGKRCGGFVEGLLAIIVDHNLRPESKQEATIVSRRLSDMGIRCEIASCDWPDGRPKQGHLQESAREMRYQLLQDVCFQNQIGVLLIAHHADDQAELFILRLSRNSGVLGLAGMAFTSQIFSSGMPLSAERSKTEGILLVRPLLCFSKEDLYKICEAGYCDWVEDPTNCNPLFARNRIRMSLGNLSSCAFQSELQEVISACRRTRTYVDRISLSLIIRAVTIVHQQGYAIINLMALNSANLPDICLSKFVAVVLQYISQRHRPVRGSASTLLLNYIRTYPCKTSLTAAGCYLCPAPGSRGAKLLVCCSVDGPLPSKRGLVCMHFNREHNDQVTTELVQIISTGRSYSSGSVLNESILNFLDVTSDSVLAEAKRLNMISESTYRSILLLRQEETKCFRPETEVKIGSESKNDVEPVIISRSEPLQPGKTYYFMNRFLLTWKLDKHAHRSSLFQKVYSDRNSEEKNSHHNFCCCGLNHDMAVEVRCMIEADWLHLADLSKSQYVDNLTRQRVSETEEMLKNINKHVDFLRLSAQEALKMLKSIPVAARRSLPVLVTSQGQLLSIPSIGFNCCPCFMGACVFKPKIPLGGGHTSFL